MSTLFLSFFSFLFFSFFSSFFLFFLLFLSSLSLSHCYTGCPSLFIFRFIYFCLLSLFLVISPFLQILFLLFGLRNYGLGFVLVTPLYPSLSLSHTSGISVAVLVSLLVSLIRVLSLSFFPSNSVSLPLSLSRPLHLSVLLYTHCEDLGNEVDPPPRPYHPPCPPSFSCSSSSSFPTSCRC